MHAYRSFTEKCISAMHFRTIVYKELTSSKDTRVNLDTTPSSAPNDVEVYVDIPALNASSDEVVVSSNVRESEIDARITQATCMHTELATKKGFSVHNVPADGDCLFSAIALQLESLGIQAVRSQDLRHNLVKYMQENPAIGDNIIYKDFLCELQHHHDDNILNADTENPTEEDHQISAVEDLESRTELRWIRYLHRLQEGAWGDYLAVQALARMLNVSIVIISTLNPNMHPVEPPNGSSIGSIYLGLIVIMLL